MNTDAKAYLNRLLTSKPPVTYTRSVPVQTEHCVEIPSESDHPGHTSSHRICNTVTTHQQRPYSDHARVNSTNIEEVIDLQLLEEKVVTLPEKIRMSKQRIENCGPASLSSTISLSVTGTEGYAITKTKTITTSSTIGVNLRFKGVFGSLGTSFSFSESTSIGGSETESYSKSVHRGLTTSISVPAKTALSISVLAYETTIEIPFKAKVVIDGELVANQSGITRANQLISKEERTLEFSGILILTGVSESFVRTDSLPGNLCENKNDGDVFYSEITEDILLATSLPKEMLQDFSSNIKNIFNNKPYCKKIYSEKTDKEIIGPISDGIHYEIISTRNFTRTDISCGFNDIGVPNLGMYIAEDRQYYEYANNQMIRMWIETIETFVDCWSV